MLDKARSVRDKLKKATAIQVQKEYSTADRQSLLDQLDIIDDAIKSVRAEYKELGLGLGRNVCLARLRAKLRVLVIKQEALKGYTKRGS